MTEEIFDALGPMLTRWTMGASAAPIAPPSWRDAIGGDTGEAELRLLALSGHFLGVAVLADPQSELHTLPDLPRLALPTLPHALRSLARRVQQNLDGGRRADLLRFLAARGWTMHPADWLPAVGDDEAPDVYAPWRDWAAAASADTALEPHADDALTPENWGEYWPAQRVAALKELRRRAPDAARTLLEMNLAAEGADARLRLLRVLADRLAGTDAAFLETLSTSDRAPKVKALAASLLARLGRGANSTEDVAELAGFFALSTKGFLRRSRVVTPQPLKTSAQIERRRTLLAEIDVTAFASALKLSPSELLQAWKWGEDAQADIGLAAMTERSGTDEMVMSLAALLADQEQPNLPALQTLSPRLNETVQRQLAERLLRGGLKFEDALAIGGPACRIVGAIYLPAGKTLLNALKDENESRSPLQISALLALGLIASRAAATQALEQLTRAGLLQADPRLDMIRLNAALDDKGVQE